MFLCIFKCWYQVISRYLATAYVTLQDLGFNTRSWWAPQLYTVARNWFSGAQRWSGSQRPAKSSWFDEPLFLTCDATVYIYIYIYIYIYVGQKVSAKLLKSEKTIEHPYSYLVYLDWWDTKSTASTLGFRGGPRIILSWQYNVFGPKLGEVSTCFNIWSM